MYNGYSGTIRDIRGKTSYIDNRDKFRRNCLLITRNPSSIYPNSQTIVSFRLKTDFPDLLNINSNNHLSHAEGSRKSREFLSSHVSTQFSTIDAWKHHDSEIARLWINRFVVSLLHPTFPFLRERLTRSFCILQRTLSSIGWCVHRGFILGRRAKARRGDYDDDAVPGFNLCAAQPKALLVLAG